MEITIKLSPAKSQALAQRLSEVGSCLPEAVASVLLIAFAESAPPAVVAWMRERLKSSDPTAVPTLWAAHAAAVHDTVQQEYAAELQLAAAIRNLNAKPRQS